MSLIMKTVFEKPITDEDMQEDLYEICSNVYSNCHSGCPVYCLNGYSVPKGGKHGCLCFKNGEKMLSFIREKMKETQQSGDAQVSDETYSKQN